jgi:hypothetical protein
MAHSECVNCGAAVDLTRDHVPPKNLFPKPRPELFTVASCRACNNGASEDDEYFRLTLSMAEGSGDHPDAKGVLPAVLRSLEHASATARSHLSRSTPLASIQIASTTTLRNMGASRMSEE